MVAGAQMGRSAHGGRAGSALPWGGRGRVPLTNLDLLDWFGPDERSECPACRRRACVSLPDVEASFCLGCGAIEVGDVRIDVHGLLPG